MESHSWANLFRKQEVHKNVLLLQRFARSQGKRGENGRGSFHTMDLSITTHFLWWECIVLAETPQQGRIRGISNQPGRVWKAAPFHYGQVFSAGERTPFFLSPYSITHTHKTGNSWARRWQTLSNVFRTHTPLAKQWEMYLVQEGSKPTQVISRVRSPGRADTGWPHGVRELKALTRSCCSVPRVCFNCESKSASDMRCTARGGGRRENGRRSLPEPDREMGKYQEVYLQKKPDFILFLLLLDFSHLCTPRLLWCFWNTR